jgi:cupin 2 domain-containing protein
MLKPESLFAEAAPEAAEEVFTTLFEKPGLKIERIASHGHASPAGFWYDQEQEEWVLLVRGEAVLQFEGRPDLHLKAGDHLRIPAHLRHRVASVSADALWLAVHF